MKHLEPRKQLVRRFAPAGLVLAVIVTGVTVGAAQSDPGAGTSVPTLQEFNSLEQRVTALESKASSTPTPTPTQTATPTPTQTTTSTPTQTATPTPTETATPTPTETATPTPVSSGDLPYTAGSFFKSRVDGAGVPVDATLTTQMHNFMMNGGDPDQAGVTWPKVNLNPGWSGHNYVHRSSKNAPVWKLTGTSTGTSNERLNIARTQGVHMPDDIWSTVPTGDQDRLLVVRDHVFGYTVQCADVVPNKTARTWSATNCGIMWHSSNGLDYRNPQSDDQRNFTSRGRLIDAMQVPREELDRAVANGTGLGRVMHLFWVATEKSAGFTHPMVGTESNTGGWGGEGWRLRINPAVDLQARGLTGAALAIARTLQQNGAYIGDNSGSATQLKLGPPEDYVGTNLATDVYKDKLRWTDFQVIKPGHQ